jgi:hypothetical protein
MLHDVKPVTLQPSYYSSPWKCRISAGRRTILPECLNRQYLMDNWLACKGKVIPLQAWTDPEGSRRLRLPDFMTVGT